MRAKPALNPTCVRPPRVYAVALDSLDERMSGLELGPFQTVNCHQLLWRPSTAAAGVFVKDIATAAGWEMQLVRFGPGARLLLRAHENPEFLFILEWELVQAGRRLGPGGRATPVQEV
jgi:hypothetical protein